MCRRVLAIKHYSIAKLMNENKNYNLILCHSMTNFKMLTIQIWKYTTLLNYEINENYNY